MDISFYELVRLEQDYFQIKVITKNNQEYDFRAAMFSTLSDDGEYDNQKYLFIRTNYDISDEEYELRNNNYEFYGTFNIWH